MYSGPQIRNDYIVPASFLLCKLFRWTFFLVKRKKRNDRVESLLKNGRLTTTIALVRRRCLFNIQDKSEIVHEIMQSTYSFVELIGSLFLSRTVECQNYQVLADASRNVNHGANPLLCDNHLTPNWYRFQGAAGVKMLSSCPQKSRCGTHATGWLSGDHPSVEEGKVTRKVCFSWSNCCTWSIDIQVMNCGDFYIYYIDGTPREHQCHLRYCGTA